jgi:hypothetical protein
MSAQPATVTLAPDQLDVLAALVARHLAATLAAPADANAALIEASEVARRHGVTRAWVYEHADRLGAIRLSGGTRPRLRFDPARVAAALTDQPEPAPPICRSPTRRRRNTTDGGAPLLPIGPGRTA